VAARGRLGAQLFNKLVDQLAPLLACCAVQQRGNDYQEDTAVAAHFFGYSCGLAGVSL
jgi:hypothetical protein